MSRRACKMLTAAVVLSTITTPTAVAADSAWPQQQRLTWKECDLPRLPAFTPERWKAAFAGLDCATVTVPMDYREPRGRTLDLTVTRLKAKNPAQRQGVLLTNPGGPGLHLGVLDPKRYEGQAIAQSFDLIGFAPRGLKFTSGELKCDFPQSPGTDTRAKDQLFAAIAEEARQLERSCQQHGGDLRQHISTANTARDMDVIRAALGEKKINYLGVSYGTHLGAVYGTLFPHRLNRSVLDSAMHPDWLYYQANWQATVAATKNARLWMTWVAERHAVYGLGTTQAEVEKRLTALREKLHERPTIIPGYGEVDGKTLDWLIGMTTGPRALWADFAETLRRTEAELKGGTVTDDTARALRLLTENAATQQGSDNYQAITCEADAPTDLNTYFAKMQTFREKHPYAEGAMAAAPTNCVFHSFTPPEKLVNPKRTAYQQGLVVQADSDAATPHQGGAAMAARQWRRSSATACSRSPTKAATACT